MMHPSEAFSKTASFFSFCKGAVTRLPLKCDRSTMGRDLEEVQWHHSLCLLSLLPAPSHTETPTSTISHYSATGHIDAGVHAGKECTIIIILIILIIIIIILIIIIITYIL